PGSLSCDTVRPTGLPFGTGQNGRVPIGRQSPMDRTTTLRFPERQHGQRIVAVQERPPQGFVNRWGTLPTAPPRLQPNKSLDRTGGRRNRIVRGYRATPGPCEAPTPKRQKRTAGALLSCFTEC